MSFLGFLLRGGGESCRDPSGAPCVHVWFHCVTACIQLIKVEQRNTELNNLSQLAILPQEVASAELASVSANCACCGNETLRCCGGELRRFKMLRAFCRDFALSFGKRVLSRIFSAQILIVL